MLVLSVRCFSTLENIVNHEVMGRPTNRRLRHTEATGLASGKLPWRTNEETAGAQPTAMPMAISIMLCRQWER